MNQDRGLRRSDTPGSDDDAEGFTRPTGSRRWSRMTIGDSARVQMGDSHTYHQYFTDDGPSAKRQKSEYAEQRRETLRKEFLDSLRFPEMFARQGSLRTNTSGTYEWVFTEESSYNWSGSNSSTEDRECRGRILAWLKNAESFFWIQGKPGSGKSMLMSFLLNDPRTTTNLQMRKGDCMVHVFTFFFWKPGSDLQKTIPGLLRSLLWQLVRSKPNAVDDMLTQDPSLTSTAWHEAKLIDHIERLVELYRCDRILFLIDGLDECEDDHGELVNLIRRLGSSDHVKTCVSSRPEAALTMHFDTTSDVSLQYLNFNDILTHAKQVFEPYGEEIKALADDVAIRAEGVFLWAALVCKSLIRGYMDRDDDVTMRARLATFPRGLEEFFGRMFSQIDGVHHQSLKFYFNAVDYRAGSTPLALIAATLHGHLISSFEHFVEVCRDEEDRIVAQSRGLIEISAPRDIPYIYDSDETYRTWALKAFSTGEPSQQSFDLGEPEMWEISQTLGWVHRSAYEYIHGVSRTDSTFRMNGNDEDYQGRRLWQGMVWLTQFLPLVDLPIANGLVCDLGYKESTFLDVGILADSGLSQGFSHEIECGLHTIHDAICSWMRAMEQDDNFDERLMSTCCFDLDITTKPVLEPMHWFWRTMFIYRPGFLAQNWEKLLHRYKKTSLLRALTSRLLSTWDLYSPRFPEEDVDDVDHQRFLVIQLIANYIHIERYDGHSTGSHPAVWMTDTGPVATSSLDTCDSSNFDTPDEELTLSDYVDAFTGF